MKKKVPSFLNKMEYIDKGSYYLFTAEQRGEDWKNQRLGRLTTTVVNGLYNCGYEKRQQILREVCGLEERKFDDEAIRLMDQGVKHEPISRKKFSEKYSLDVSEVGFAVPKWNNYIGASTDGICSDDMLLEIKSPEYMYSEIKFIKNNTIAFPQECNPEKRHLVKENHFDQMQMEIAVFGKKGIHYFVDAVKEESSHHVVVDFDLSYWKCAYFQLVRIINQELKKMHKENEIELISPWETK
jgi:hypothetical protein